MNRIERRPQFRVAVNSRCGRMCFYCRPSGEAVQTAPGIELAPNDLFKVAKSVRRLGLDSIKLTGGDPALYRPLIQVVATLKSEIGYAHVEVISRHPRIGILSPGLAAAGVDQVNISLDTLDPVKHKTICGVDDLSGVLAAIKACVSVGLKVKVNTVVMRNVNDQEILRLIDYCASMGVTTVKLLDVIGDLDEGDESFGLRLRQSNFDSLQSLYTPFDAISEHLNATAVSRKTYTQGDLGHPLTAYTLPSGIEVVLKDSRTGAWYGIICAGCPHYPCHDALMALRLTADLRLQYCLLRADNTVNLASHIGNTNENELDQIVSEALGVYSLATFTTAARKHPDLITIG